MLAATARVAVGEQCFDVSVASIEFQSLHRLPDLGNAWVWRMLSDCLAVTEVHPASNRRDLPKILICSK